MTSVTVGVHVYAEPERLRVTLASLAAYTAPSATVLLLPDGPDVSTAALLTTLDGTRQLATPVADGAPACFNRLARATDSDVVVFLESGAVVGPGWLDRLLDALAADSGHGLAGASTKRAW